MGTGIPVGIIVVLVVLVVGGFVLINETVHSKLSGKPLVEAPVDLATTRR